MWEWVQSSMSFIKTPSLTSQNYSDLTHPPWCCHGCACHAQSLLKIQFAPVPILEQLCLELGAGSSSVVSHTICSLVWHWAHTPCCLAQAALQLHPWKLPVLTGWWRSAPRFPPAGAAFPPASASSPAAAWRCIPLSSAAWWHGWSRPNTHTAHTLQQPQLHGGFVLLTCSIALFSFPSLCV